MTGESLAMAAGRILELGCGVGLLGLITASLQKSLIKPRGGTFSLHMTDVEEGVLATCKQNFLLPASMCGRNFCSIDNLHNEPLRWPKSCINVVS
jgi:hypothetical protein